jgi:hypothetical protein
MQRDILAFASGCPDLDTPEQVTVFDFFFSLEEPVLKICDLESLS